MTPMAYSDDFTLIGINDKGEPLEIPLKKKIWNTKIKKAIHLISNSTLSSLEKMNEKNGHLTFNRVDIGTYIKIKLGLGNLVQASAGPYFKLFFTKN
jgi:hypothetical protein